MNRFNSQATFNYNIDDNQEKKQLRNKIDAMKLQFKGTKIKTSNGSKHFHSQYLLNDFRNKPSINHRLNKENYDNNANIQSYFNKKNDVDQIRPYQQRKKNIKSQYKVQQPHRNRKISQRQQQYKPIKIEPTKSYRTTQDQDFNTYHKYRSASRITPHEQDRRQSQHSVSKFSTRRNLQQAITLQNQSLRKTISLMKQQLQILQQNNQKNKKDLKISKKIIKKQDDDLQVKENQIRTLKLKVSDYDLLLPKLSELEVLQNGIMDENSSLKSRMEIYESLIRNLTNIAKKQSGNSCREKMLLLLQAWNQRDSYENANKNRF